MATDKGFFNYCIVENSVKEFITHTDSRKFWISDEEKEATSGRPTTITLP